MPQISTKGLQMTASPIRKLVPYAEAVKKKGRTTYHLNIGQPDIETPQVASDAIKNLNLPVVEYSHSAGFESYRKGLAEYYKSLGINVTHENIIVTNGGSEAILIEFMPYLNQGDEIIIPEPFYANYIGFACASGVKIKPITSSIDAGFALPPISEFEKLITPKTKGIMICNPGNPTGYLYTKEELEALKEFVKKHDLYLFADEVYRDFCYGGISHNSAMHHESIDNNVILIDSVSKRYSMCGTRIGTFVSQNKEMMDTAVKFAQARLSPPTFGQIAGAALKTPKTYFANVIKEYVERRNTVVEGINNIEGAYYPKPNGAFYCIAKLPIDNVDRSCQWLRKEFEYENQTIMLAPAFGFYSTPRLGLDEVRIAYVLNIDALKNAVKCLEEALKVYPGRTIKTDKENEVLG